MRWGTVALVGTVGTAFAIATLAFASRTDVTAGASIPGKNHVRYTPSSVPTVSVERHLAVGISDASEVQMLKTRNRRLEALVAVLRERAARSAQVIASGR